MVESPEELTYREVKEESELTITKPALKGILAFKDFDETNDWMVFVFIATQFSSNHCDEVLEWIPNEKL